MDGKKILVLSTAFAALVAICIGAVYRWTREPDAIVLETVGFPSIGNSLAKVEVVVIEDLRCCNCREFTARIFPQIQERYIATGEIRFTIVPVAFISGSKPIANAALEVYKHSADRFFAFIEEVLPLCQSERIHESELLRIAEKVGGIDLAKLENCIRSDCHYWELDRNLEWAQAIMGKDFGTPALYVNGRQTSTRSFHVVQQKIDQLLHGTELNEKR